MAEFFTADQLSLLSATTVRCDLVCKFEFASSTEWAWNGNTDLIVGGNTYKPMRGYGRIDGLGLAAGTLSEVVTMTLDGLPDMPLDFLAKALADTEEVDQRIVTIGLQLFNNEWQPVGSPIPLFRGFTQPPVISRTPMEGAEGATQTVTITAENVFYGRSRPPHGRNTDRDQQARSPGDKFFGFVASLLSKVIRYPDF
jgi:hypothetical protein